MTINQNNLQTFLLFTHPHFLVIKFANFTFNFTIVIGKSVDNFRKLTS